MLRLWLATYVYTMYVCVDLGKCLRLWLATSQDSKHEYRIDVAIPPVMRPTSSHLFTSHHDSRHTRSST